MTFILKFGNDFRGKFRQWLGTEITRLDLERPSRLNGGDSQVYDCWPVKPSLTECLTQSIAGKNTSVVDWCTRAHDGWQCVCQLATADRHALGLSSSVCGMSLPVDCLDSLQRSRLAAPAPQTLTLHSICTHVATTEYSQRLIDWLIDWVRLNVPPTQYRSYGDGFLRVKWPNQQCQSTEWTLNQIKQNTTMHLN